MVVDLSRLSIYVRPGAADMRKQINGPAVIVEESTGGQPLSGNLYLFCNHRRIRVDAQNAGETGGSLEQHPFRSPHRLHYSLRYKRLERERFPWPEGEAQAREISVEELRMLLAGIDFWKAHRKLEYTRVR